MIGISRDQWRLVAAVGGARRQRAGRARGQLLPARRRDGALERRPDRAGAADRGGRRPARGDGRRGARAARHRRGASPRERAVGHQGARPLAAAAGRLLLAAAGRLRRRRAQGRGHRHGRLRALVAALPRGRRGLGEVGAVPVAQPRQALDPAQPQGGGRPRGAAAARARARRAARVVSARGDGAARRGLRAPARGEPAARLLRDHRLRPGRSLHGSLGPRHELPRPQRAARADGRRGRAAGPVGRADRGPRRRRADGGVRHPGGAARARAQRARVSSWTCRCSTARSSWLAHGGGPLPVRRRGARRAATSSWPGA